MLTILPKTAKDDLIPYCQTLKKPYYPGFYLYQAADGPNEIAWGLFEIRENQATALAYQTTAPEDFYLLDGILRAGFHFADQQGIEHGEIPEPLRQELHFLFRKLNYPVEATFSIRNFFAKYKNCKSLPS